jgi:hypothetical protein
VKTRAKRSIPLANGYLVGMARLLQTRGFGIGI